MKPIPQELANEIGRLAYDYKSVDEFLEYYNVKPVGFTIYRNFDSNELLASIFICNNDGRKQFDHIDVFKNGDIVGREAPYYDGDLSNLIFVRNQQAIYKLLTA